MKNSATFLPLLLVLLTSSLAKAQNQEAHVHGEATLTLAIENKVLEIEFESPSANLVGFEHKAHSEKEKQAVKQAKKTLQSPKTLFAFNGTTCKLKASTLDFSGVSANSKSDHQEEGHHKEAHHDKEHHGEAHHDKEHHGDEHHSGEHEHSAHSKIIASYRFECKNTSKLNAVSTELFKTFPKIEKIHAMWLSENKQGIENLKPGKNSISLK